MSDENAQGRRNHGSLVARWALVGAVVAVPITTALVLTSGADRALDDLTPEWVPVYFPIETQVHDVSAEITVSAVIEEPITIASSSQEGVITAIHVGGGDVLAMGDRVLDVNGVGVLAYVPHQEAVFYRDLCRGDSGNDVALLQRILASRGLYSANVDGEFGWATERAVIALDRQLGEGLPTGCFTLSRVVALPDESMEVGEVLGDLGEYIPGRGSPLLRGASQPVEVTLSAPGFSGPPGDYELSAGGSVVTVTRSESGWSIDPSDAAAIFAQASGAEGPIEYLGRIHSIDPVPVQVLPESAPFVARDGSLCVAIASDTPGGDELLREIVMVPVAGLAGVGIAPDPILEGTSVLVNPPARFSERECR